ncbi:hypothetical protein EKO27_g10710 [Xylaria grammica]|uniref:PNPLA domain-containing protein n=1 Tax=Xylaria grammica TaxID=363999 RepID=A0A439CQF5_9PEZI|nr:hypothetical protein EKO27_g10710 [Xylaria grammica]
MPYLASRPRHFGGHNFFKSIRIGRDEVEFIDAGFGYNNPCELIIREAERIFPADSELKILSIGTGVGDAVTVKDKRLSIVKALKKMATSSSKVDAALYNIYGDDGRYYRFVVNEGLGNVALSDWELTSQISAHTHNYIRSQQKRIELYVKDFMTDTRSSTFPNPEPERKATRETTQKMMSQDTWKPARFIQNGSVFTSDISAKEIKQGNRLDISQPKLYYSIIQEASNFGGHLQVEERLEQGNCITL